MMNAWGKLTSIDLKGCDIEIMKSKAAIADFVIGICKLIDMKRYGDVQIVYFGEDEKVAGYSFTQLIETSLISGHLADSSQNVYIDIFSCKDYDHLSAAMYAKDFFAAKDCLSNVLLRGKS